MRWVLALALAACLGGCQGDARLNGLQEGARMAEDLLKKPELASHGKDAQSRIKYLFSPEGAALWPPHIPQELAFDTPHPPGTLPPRVGFLTEPDLPWSIVIKGDDKDALIEAYGADLQRPLFSHRVTLP